MGGERRAKRRRGEAVVGQAQRARGEVEQGSSAEAEQQGREPDERLDRLDARRGKEDRISTRQGEEADVVLPLLPSPEEQGRLVRKPPPPKRTNKIVSSSGE